MVARSGHAGGAHRERLRIPHGSNGIPRTAGPPGHGMFDGAGRSRVHRPSGQRCCGGRELLWTPSPGTSLPTQAEAATRWWPRRLLLPRCRILPGAPRTSGAASLDLAGRDECATPELRSAYRGRRSIRSRDSAGRPSRCLGRESGLWAIHRARSCAASAPLAERAERVPCVVPHRSWRAQQSRSPSQSRPMYRSRLAARSAGAATSGYGAHVVLQTDKVIALVQRRTVPSRTR